jgi:hypothetical protein
MVKVVATDVSSLKYMLQLLETFLTLSEIQCSLYVPTISVLKNFPLCLRAFCVFRMIPAVNSDCFRINIRRLVVVMETQRVSCEVGTEFLNII